MLATLSNYWGGLAPPLPTPMRLPFKNRSLLRNFVEPACREKERQLLQFLFGLYACTVRASVWFCLGHNFYIYERISK